MRNTIDYNYPKLTNNIWIYQIITLIYLKNNTYESLVYLLTPDLLNIIITKGNVHVSLKLIKKRVKFMYTYIELKIICKSKIVSL